MNGLVALLVLFVLIGCFCLLPGLAFLVSRRLYRPASKLLLLAVLLAQVALLARLYQRPVITFAETIPETVQTTKASWVRETLGGPYAGFYSPRLPLLAHRFHVTALSDDYIAAEVFYLPLGSISVEWNSSSMYNITRPLR